jgi:hypothetical protein
MCRNITELRGLEPPATSQEVRAAAEQFVRKVSGVAKPPAAAAEIYAQTIDQVAEAMTTLLGQLPARRNPPPTLPPLRRIAARSVGAAAVTTAPSGMRTRSAR